VRATWGRLTQARLGACAEWKMLERSGAPGGKCLEYEVTGDLKAEVANAR
jgi:hypothetical protein